MVVLARFSIAMFVFVLCAFMYVFVLCIAIFILIFDIPQKSYSVIHSPLSAWAAALEPGIT